MTASRCLDASAPRRVRPEGPSQEPGEARGSGRSRNGLGDLNNGELLDAMKGIFDALVTVDKRLPQQPHMQGRPLRVVVLRAKSNRLSDLLPWVPDLLVPLSTLDAGAVKEVGS